METMKKSVLVLLYAKGQSLTDTKKRKHFNCSILPEWTLGDMVIDRILALQIRWNSQVTVFIKTISHSFLFLCIESWALI